MSEESAAPLSGAQLEIMTFVWDRGEVTVGEVWKELAAKRPLARNTVQTMMLRLKEKGWLHCDAEGHAHRFRAARPRQTAVGTMLRRLVDTAFGGSAGANAARPARRVPRGSPPHPRPDRPCGEETAMMTTLEHFYPGDAAAL